MACAIVSQRSGSCRKSCGSGPGPMLLDKKPGPKGGRPRMPNRQAMDSIYARNAYRLSVEGAATLSRSAEYGAPALPAVKRPRRVPRTAEDRRAGL